MSHQIGAEVVPFRDVFTVLFFVSVGMLVNPLYAFSHAGHVLALTALIMIGKPLFTVLIGLVLPASGRTMLVAAAGLGQIGEFSFIVGQTGVALDVLTQEQYSLILAGALLSIVFNPLLFRLLPPTERALRRLPGLWRRLDRHGAPPQITAPTLTDHVVIVGAGRVGAHIVTVLERLGIPRLILEIDAQRAADFNRRGIPTLFGDAANSEVLTHAGLDRARTLVVTLPDQATTEMVVAAARALAPSLPITARATSREGLHRLYELGAQDVIHPELEGGLEVVRHTLLHLGFPASQAQPYTDAVRHDHYETTISTAKEHQVLDQLRNTVRGFDLAWRRLEEQSPLIGQTPMEANVRQRSGASIIAIIRNHHVLPNPKSGMRFEAGDLIGLIGDAAQVAAFDHLFASPTHPVVAAENSPSRAGTSSVSVTGQSGQPEQSATG